MDLDKSPEGELTRILPLRTTTTVASRPGRRWSAAERADFNHVPPPAASILDRFAGFSRPPGGEGGKGKKRAK